MKRAFFLLATFTAIILLSCSDNSNPLTEELNLPQSTALEKVNTGASPMATGSSKVSSGSPWSVAGVSVGSTQCSNELYFLFSTPPTGSIVSGLTFCPGSSGTITGSFAINSLTIRCVPPPPPNNTTTISWTGSGCVSTSYFNGQPARGMECYVKFCGNCVGGYYVAGQYVPQCNRSFSGGNLTSYYTY